jgi:enoyl-CoA hydratase/carnithine racemase
MTIDTPTPIQIDTGTDQLLCEIRDRVAIITLNRPDARNALSDQLTPALRRMVRERGDDDRVGALLITGAGKAFCAGGDVKGMGDRSAKAHMTPEQRIAEMIERHRGVTGALLAVRKPVIAALPGAAAGAGLAIAMACDLRIAAESAFVSAGYSRIGLSGDFGIAWLLTRAIGSPLARQMLFTSERVPAARALQIGLVNRVVPDAQLHEEAFQWTRGMANGPAIALRAIKDNLDDALEIDHDTALVREAERLVPCSYTEDHKEAVRAFVEKRDPVFRGR